MWSSTISDKTLFNGDLKVTVTYINGSQRFTETYMVTSKDDMNRRVRARLATLNAQETEVATIATGAYTPTADPVQTQAEIDRNDWFRDFNRVERVTKLQDLGCMPASWQADFDALKTKVQTNAKKAYIADM